MTRRIRKLLVANRAEIARRVMRTARELGIATVAVFSDPDQGAPFVREADESVHLPGAASGETYLDIDKIIDATLVAGADAVHPGYGFLSENGDLARACEGANLVFIGPPAAVIDAMGSKINAKAMMVEAGIPVLAGFTIDERTTSEELAHEADRIGLPVLVKASSGGGGRGMRVVRRSQELTGAVAEAQREAASAFGDGSVFLEKYLESPRHVEIQVFGDSHGNVVSIFERECSIQRRHQKIIEEAPSPAVDAELRAQIGNAAVAVARSIGYVSAGTVEFVLDEGRRFYFLEMNTRLQVEHPVTEMVTGLDLVRLQLEVASGEPLPKILFEARMTGHAIEARLYAEDVSAGFLPTSGYLHRLDFPVIPGVRVESGYESGGSVSTHYDAMLAKVIAWAPSRHEAATKLADALARVVVHGPVTNRDLLVQTLRTEDFLSGRTDTGFFERHDPALLSRTMTHGDAPRLHPIAVAVHRIVHGGRFGPQPATLPPSWRNVGGGTAPLCFEMDADLVDVPGRLAELPEGISVGDVGPGSVVLEHDHVRREYQVEQSGTTWYVDGRCETTVLVEVPRFPAISAPAAVGSLIAPLPGTVVAVTVAVGDTVERGDVVVTLEAMKMEHAVRAPRRGTVGRVRVAAGDQVEAGDVLVVVEDDDDGDSVGDGC
jgi:propionyl-CoA carboxylase alpha chain